MGSGCRKQQVAIFLHKLGNRAAFVDANCLVLPYLVSVYILNFPEQKAALPVVEKTLFFCVYAADQTPATDSVCGL